MFEQTEDKFVVNCARCGTVNKTEREINFHEDETAQCSCGTKLTFVRNFKNKTNTFAFE